MMSLALPPLSAALYSDVTSQTDEVSISSAKTTLKKLDHLDTLVQLLEKAQSEATISTPTSAQLTEYQKNMQAFEAGHTDIQKWAANHYSDILSGNNHELIKLAAEIADRSSQIYDDFLKLGCTYLKTNGKPLVFTNGNYGDTIPLHSLGGTALVSPKYTLQLNTTDATLYQNLINTSADPKFPTFLEQTLYRVFEATNSQNYINSTLQVFDNLSQKGVDAEKIMHFLGNIDFAYAKDQITFPKFDKNTQQKIASLLIQTDVHNEQRIYNLTELTNSEVFFTSDATKRNHLLDIFGTIPEAHTRMAEFSHLNADQLKKILDYYNKDANFQAALNTAIGLGGEHLDRGKKTTTTAEQVAKAFDSMRSTAEHRAAYRGANSNEKQNMLTNVFKLKTSHEFTALGPDINGQIPQAWTPEQQEEAMNLLVANPGLWSGGDPRPLYGKETEGYWQALKDVQAKIDQK